MTQQQINELDSYYVLHYDKWYRMCGGTATTLYDFRDQTVYLEIFVSPTCKRTARNLAEHHAYKRREALKQLADATRYHATIHWYNHRADYSKSQSIENETELIAKTNQRLAELGLTTYYRSVTLEGGIPIREERI